MGRTYSWSVDRLAGETQRFTRDQRARKRISEFSDIDVDLQCDRRCPLPGFDRVHYPANPAHFEPGAGDRRLDPGERREILSLSNNNPTDQVTASLGQIVEKVISGILVAM